MGEIEQCAQALQGLRILDLADEKGVYCAKLLADRGADVVKIEQPDGDSSRDNRPFTNNHHASIRSLSFWYHNAGKRGITLAIDTHKGQALFRKLVETADVVVETFQPGYLEDLGLGYQALHAINSHLIMTSITHFGQTGLYKDYHSCNLVASALGGQMHICGEPQTRPLTPYGEQAYLISSMFGAIGTLTALHLRRLSGEGQQVDISVQECIAAAIEPVNARYVHDGHITDRQGRLHWNNAFRVFPCRDGYILLSLFQQWDTLVEWLDSEGMAADLMDEKWQHYETRVQEVAHIIAVLEQWTSTHTVNELVEQGQLMRFPWASVDSLDALAWNPQLRSRQFFLEEIHSREHSHIKQVGPPYKLSKSPHQSSSRPPMVGEHNKEIYIGELRLSDI